jgi:hypothetical protein
VGRRLGEARFARRAWLWVLPKVNLRFPNACRPRFHYLPLKGSAAAEVTRAACVILGTPMSLMGLVRAYQGRPYAASLASPYGTSLLRGDDEKRPSA